MERNSSLISIFCQDNSQYWNSKTYYEIDLSTKSGDRMVIWFVQGITLPNCEN